MKILSVALKSLLSIGLFTCFSVTSFAQDADSTAAADSAYAEVIESSFEDEPVVETPKKYQGLLWQITGNGLKKPSYLYGTMHVSDRIAFRLGDTFFLGLKSVDYVTLESDPAYWIDNMQNTGDYGMSIKENDYYGDYSYGGNGFYNSTFNYKPIKSSNLGGLLSETSDYSNFLLYRKQNYAMDYQENTYLDMFIYQSGLKYKKKVAGLENWEESRKLVAEGEKPDKNEKTDPDDRFNRRNKGESLGEKIEEAYRNEDLDLLDTLNKQSSSKKSHEYIVVKRNENMVEAMDSLMKLGSIFSGVGAAHLPGDRGMVELLRKLGYTVRAVKRNFNKKSNAMREKLEQQYVKVEMKETQSEDGFINCQLPGKILDLGGRFNEKTYLCPDFTNGAYYTISRYKYKAALFNISPETMRKSLDSQVFENIPGKVVWQKNKVFQGYPALEILNKTKTGDYQRSMYVFTPVELISVKFIGQKDYGQKKEVETFFTSLKINLNGNSDQKQTYSPEAGGYVVTVPGQIVSYATKIGKGKNTRGDDNFESYNSKSGDFYALETAFLNDYYYIEEDTFEGARLAENLFPGKQYKHITTNHTTANGLHVSDASYSNLNNDSVWARFITSGNKYYMLMAKTNNKRNAFDYFNSFEIKDFNYRREFEKYHDTDMFFSVEMPKVLDTKDEEEEYSYWGYYGRESSSDFKDKFSSVSHYKIFNYLPTDDRISVNYYKPHKYNFIEYTDSMKRESDSLTKFGNSYFQVLQKRAKSDQKIKLAGFKSDSAYQFIDVIITDTGSTKAIRKISILNKGIYYQINTMYDSISGMSKFQKTFWETFKLDDTTLCDNPFNNKADSFFTHIYSNDSNTRKSARLGIDEIEFKDKHVPEMIKMFNHGKFDDNYLNMRLKIISYLGYLKHKDILPFLKNVYMNGANNDTPAYQFGALRAIASQKSDKSAALFMELINEETPLSEEIYDIHNSFDGFFDSLKIGKLLYPSVMRLTRYPEYKDLVYSMLTRMLDSGVIDAKFYQNDRPIIEGDALDELKRQYTSSLKRSQEKKLENEYGAAIETDYAYNRNYNDYAEEENTYASYSDELINYSKLLIPNYGDIKPQKFFSRLNKTPDEDLKLKVITLLAYKNKSVNDTMWSHFAKSLKYRFALYQSLKEDSTLKYFPKEYLNQKSLVESKLFSSKYDYNPEKDTMAFIGKYPVNSRKDTGFVYFYKVRKKKVDDSYYIQDNWEIFSYGIQPKDSSTFNSDAEFISSGEEIDEDHENADTIIRETIKQIMWNDRKRYKKESENRSYTYDY